MPSRESAHAELPVTPRGFVESLLDNVEDMVYTCAEDGRITSFNRTLTEAITPFAQRVGDGITLDEWESFRELYLPGGEKLRPRDSPMRRVLRGEPVQDLELIAKVGDDVRMIRVNGLQYLDDDGCLAGMLVVRDITQQRLAEAERDFSSSHDPLTGLPNRALFVRSVAAALHRAAASEQRCAILHIDIDRFHGISAAAGFEAGQAVLRQVAARIESVLRAGGRTAEPAADDPVLHRLVVPDDATASQTTAMARVGADEFLALCEDVTDRRAVEAVVTRISEALARPIVVGEHRHMVTTTIGVTLCGDATADTDQLIAQAEVATHRARRVRGGGHAFYELNEAGDETRRASDIDELRHAIGSDELRLVYQPQVSLPDERLVGVEALVRWDHPERGEVAPLDFIPLAEETGLIVPLGQWVLEEACQQAARWRGQNPAAAPLTVSVNVSARQLEGNLVGTVVTALERSGIDPGMLCIEVTESGVMRDVQTAIAALESVRSLGVRISVDDFGTGYSSLAYLKRLPADELKVDKSFVDGLGDDPDDTAIVAAVVASAHALGLTVVAEGVESQRNVDSLVTLGCEVAQGYFYSRPVAASAISGMLAGSGLGGRARTGPAPRPIDVVLVVDDAADVRQLARLSLAAFGFEVHEAAAGRDAIAAALDLQPDCVVLDLNLPDMSGFEVCRSLRRTPTASDCTIVMVTSAASAAEKVEAFSAGADEYIVKPFTPRDLGTRVRTAMRLHAAQARRTLATGA